jgi:stage III sporulation protein AD
MVLAERIRILAPIGKIEMLGADIGLGHLQLTDLPLTLFVPVVKVTAIALVARFSCALCADAGQSALSSLLAAAGTLCALVCALPLMEALLEMVEGFL